MAEQLLSRFVDHSLDCCVVKPKATKMVETTNTDLHLCGRRAADVWERAEPVYVFMSGFVEHI